MKTIYVVIDPLITDDNSWEPHIASLLHGYVEASDLDSEFKIEQITDLHLLKSYFQHGVIKSNDRFIFPNAWTSMVTYVKHWSENYQIPVEMIGFWSRGCYINQDSEFRPLNDRNWRKVHERASHRCLDKSYFISEFHKEQFRIYVSKNVFPERLHVSEFPLDYLNLESATFTEANFKQNLLIFPWSKYTDFHEQIMYDFIRVFKDIGVLFAQEKRPMERYQVLNQISKSKVAFLPYTFPNIGKEIYECALLNTITLVPDIEGFKEFVPDEFRYPPEWTDGIFNYCRYAPELTEKIKMLTYHYDDYKPIIEYQQEHLYKTFFNSEKIVKELFGNYDKI